MIRCSTTWAQKIPFSESSSTRDRKLDPVIDDRREPSGVAGLDHVGVGVDAHHLVTGLLQNGEHLAPAATDVDDPPRTELGGNSVR